MSSSISEVPNPSAGAVVGKSKNLERNRPSVKAKKIGKRKENTTTGGVSCIWILSSSFFDRQKIVILYP